MQFNFTANVGNKVVDEKVINIVELKNEMNAWIDEISIADVETGIPITFTIKPLGDTNGS